MCGIVALFTRAPVDDARRALLKDMARSIKHRGPDHQGEWWDAELPLGLAHRRLSIVDLSPDGHQPMLSLTRRYVITFNGEIYNYQTLRDELRNLGVVFRGRSDTEVFLAAVENWGLNIACQKINGMFAIVLYDRHERKLHLIRDRMGKKPLYFGWAGGDFVCASELKPFLTHPDFTRTISTTALDHYLHLGFIPAPHSIFSGVSMVVPGARVMIDLGSLKPGQSITAMDPYWNPARVVEDAMARRTVMGRMSYDDRLRETEQLISTCVADRMMADVPLGAFLSGGIDSSLVVALMQKQSNDAVKTYSIGFEEEGFNEAEHAARVAHHLGTDHHQMILTANDTRSIIPDLPTLMDEPMADVSIIPTTLVSRFARSDVTVALTGDGGDELFGGYYRHVQIKKIASAIHMMPRGLRRSVQSAIKAITPAIAPLIGGAQSSTTGRIEKLAAVLSYNDLPDLYEFLIGGAEENAMTTRPRKLFGYPFRSSHAWPTGLSVPEWVMFADTIHYLPGDVLTKVDRATMSVGLEARAPLLDQRLFAHAWTLPLGDKINGGKGKRILRDILARHVPRDIIDRPKQGFGVPIGAWLRGPLQQWADDLLRGPILVDHFGLDRATIDRVWQDHLDGRHPVRETVWRLVVLAQWAQRYLKS